MEFTKSIVLLICGWSVINGILLGCYLNFNNRIKKNEANRILGLMFFLIAFKVSFPILSVFIDKSSVFHLFYFTWSVFCYLAIAPLLWLYIKSLVQDFFVFKTQYLILFLVILFVFLVPNNVGNIPLRFATYQVWMGLFIILSFVEIIKSKRKLLAEKKQIYTWVIFQVAGVSIIVITVMFGLFIELMAFFTFLIMAMIYIVTEKKYIFHFQYPKRKKLQKALSNSEANKIISKLNRIMETDKPYLNAELNLSVLAEMLNVPLHTMSRVLNENIGKNFSEYINNYRIEESKKKLLNPEYDNLNIAAIAYDCGFNSLSTFNTFFRKQTQTTPSKYKKSMNEHEYAET